MPIFGPMPGKKGKRGLWTMIGHEPAFEIESFSAWDALPDDQHDLEFELELDP